MKDRIVKFLASEKISPAEFADKIGVQRSSMSHILNGRNYPSAAFLQKMLQAYPDMNPRWLMIGDGTMNMETASAAAVSDLPAYRNDETDRKTQTLPFQDPETENSLFSSPAPETVTLPASPPESAAEPVKEPHSEQFLHQTPPSSGASKEREKTSLLSDRSSPESSIPSKGKEIEQVLFFYADKTFSVYLPS